MPKGTRELWVTRPLRGAPAQLAAHSELLNRTRLRFGDETVEVVQQLEGAQDQDQAGSLTRLALLQALHRGHRDPRLSGERCLREIAVQAMTRNSCAQFLLPPRSLK